MNSIAFVLFQSATASDDNNPGICINNASFANFVVAQDFGDNLNCFVRNVGVSGAVAIGMTTMSQTSSTVMTIYRNKRGTAYP